jgi:hypothetical protein
MSNKKISLILCYARSGGTLLNRHLVKSDNLVVLSEAHPIHHKKGGVHSLKEQLNRWYGIKIESNNYLDCIIEAKTWCDENDKHLVIRDWSYIDFSKSYLNDNKPIGESANIQLLESAGLEYNKISFVRDGIDVYLSQNKSIEEFSKEYLGFVKYLKNLNCKIFKYEVFVENMDNELASIFNELDIGSFNFLKNDNTLLTKNVVGDTSISRGNGADKPIALKRRFSSMRKKLKINSNKSLIESNFILSYSVNYSSRESEIFYDYFKFWIILNYNKTKKRVFYIFKKILNIV